MEQMAQGLQVVAGPALCYGVPMVCFEVGAQKSVS